MSGRPDDLECIKRHLRAGHTCIALETIEERHALDLVKAAAQDAGLDVFVWSAVTGLRSALLEDAEPVKDTEHPAAALFHMARHAGPAVFVALDLVEHLSDARTQRAARELIYRLDDHRGHLVLIDPSGQLPATIAAKAVRHEIALPDEQELEKILRRTLTKYNRDRRDLHVDISRSELDALVRNLRGLTRRQAERAVLETVAHDAKFDAEDVAAILETKRRLMGTTGGLEFVEAPTDLSNIGGLRRLKAWLAERSEAFSDRARDFGIDPPRGVLMLGVQGTGKSLTAKAIATAWQRPLLRMDAGALYDKYIGESERRLRNALHQAEAMAPVILWIDEIEKAFASAASHSTDGGLSRRMFGYLLTWMQEHHAPVFLVATANDIDALPPELLRKGRFDEIFFVDLPKEDVRKEILAIHLRKRKRDPQSFDLDAVARASQGFSAAELEQAVVSSLASAFAAKTDLTTDRLIDTIRNSPPLSVTAAEKIAKLQRWAEGRCVPAD